MGINNMREAMFLFFVRFTLIIICFLNIEAKAEAFSSNRAQEVVETRYFSSGPNCFSSVLYAGGLLDDFSYIGSEIMQFIFDSPFCKEIPISERKTGDITTVEGFEFRYHSYLAHTAIFSSNETAFSKMGHEPDDVIKNANYLENIGAYYKDKSCLEYAYDSSRRGDYCTYSVLYRCDFDKFLNELGNSKAMSSYKKIVKIRKKLLVAATSPGPVDKEYVGVLDSQLKSIMLTVVSSSSFSNEEIVSPWIYVANSWEKDLEIAFYDYIFLLMRDSREQARLLLKH